MLCKNNACDKCRECDQRKRFISYAIALLNHFLVFIRRRKCFFKKLQNEFYHAIYTCKKLVDTFGDKIFSRLRRCCVHACSFNKGNSAIIFPKDFYKWQFLYCVHCLLFNPSSACRGVRQKIPQ